MSLVSATGVLTPGLQNATAEQKADCVKDKAVNNLKHGLAAAGVAAAAGGSIYALATNEKVQEGAINVAGKAANLAQSTVSKIAKTGIGQKIVKGVTKVGTKIANSETLSKLATGAKSAISKVGETISKNPKLGFIMGGIALAGGLLTAFISRHQAHTNGKIEGQHQAYADIQNSYEA